MNIHLPGHIVQHVISFLTTACDVCRKTFIADTLVRDCVAYQLDKRYGRETYARRYDFICAQCFLSHAAPVRYMVP